jgi:glycerophosphoryl diester phosphodiesterase
MTGSPLVQVSAHAGYPPQAESFTMESCRAAVATGADYVEVDIRRTADDELVAFHDAEVRGRPLSTLDHAQLCDLAGYPVPRVGDALDTLAGRARGHLDLKETGYEDRVVRLALDTFGPGQFVITTSEDVSVAAIRSRFPVPGQVPAALSLGVGLRGAPPAEVLRTRLSELRPFPRLRACGADWVALNYRLAMTGLARQCRRRGLRVMVWTVDSEPGIRYWLGGQRTDVLITGHPARAIAVRDRLNRRPNP